MALASPHQKSSYLFNVWATDNGNRAFKLRIDASIRHLEAIKPKMRERMAISRDQIRFLRTLPIGGPGAINSAESMEGGIEVIKKGLLKDELTIELANYEIAVSKLALVRLEIALSAAWHISFWMHRRLNMFQFRQLQGMFAHFMRVRGQMIARLHIIKSIMTPGAALLVPHHNELWDI